MIMARSEGAWGGPLCNPRFLKSKGPSKQVTGPGILCMLTCNSNSV